MEGRVLFDLLKVVQNGYKLESYKLDDVAFHFTNQKKADLNPVEEVGEKLKSLPIVKRSNIKKLVQAIEPLKENGQKLVKAIVPLKENGTITPKTIRKVSISNLNSNLRKLFRETSIDLDKTAEIFILTFIVIYDLSI